MASDDFTDPIPIPTGDPLQALSMAIDLEWSGFASKLDDEQMSVIFTLMRSMDSIGSMAMELGEIGEVSTHEMRTKQALLMAWAMSHWIQTARSWYIECGSPDCLDGFSVLKVAMPGTDHTEGDSDER
jgi:hypothetical protein